MKRHHETPRLETGRQVRADDTRGDLTSASDCPTMKLRLESGYGFRERFATTPALSSVGASLVAGCGPATSTTSGAAPGE